MLENVGTVDRALRVVLGFGLLLAGLLGPDGAVGLIIAGVGLVLLFTGATSSCPVYKAMGKNTVEEADPRGH